MDTCTPARPAQVLRCRVCRRRLRKPSRGVPRSQHVRCVDCADADLLRAHGIDPEAARRAYERERAGRRRCGRCDGHVDPSDTTAPGDDVVCGTCLAADVEQRGAPPEAYGRARPLARVVDDTEAVRRAWAYAGFFLVGIALFASTVVGAGAAWSLLVGAAAAAVGGRATWRAYTAPAPATPDRAPDDARRPRHRPRLG